MSSGLPAASESIPPPRECKRRREMRRRAPGLSRDLEGVLADAVVVFAGHKEYRGLLAAGVRRLCGSPHPAVVDGQSVVDPDAWIAGGFAYRGIGRGDKNRHVLRE